MIYYHLDRRVLLQFEFQVIQLKKQALTTDHNLTIDRQVFVSLNQICIEISQNVQYNFSNEVLSK